MSTRTGMLSRNWIIASSGYWPGLVAVSLAICGFGHNGRYHWLSPVTANTWGSQQVVAMRRRQQCNNNKSTLAPPKYVVAAPPSPLPKHTRECCHIRNCTTVLDKLCLCQQLRINRIWTAIFLFWERNHSHHGAIGPVWANNHVIGYGPKSFTSHFGGKRSEFWWGWLKQLWTSWKNKTVQFEWRPKGNCQILLCRIVSSGSSFPFTDHTRSYGPIP